MIKDDTIKKETEKALLVHFKESKNQQTMPGFENKPIEKDIWVPKSLLNKDWKKLNQLHIPTWFYEKEF